MHVPVSTDFDLFDWNQDATTLDDGSSGILLVASKSRGSPNIAASASSLRIISNDSLSSRVWLGLNVPSIYTFEFQLLLTLLPEDFSEPDQHRVFLGILDPTGGAAGVLFSQEGLAIVGDPANPISALSGSEGLIITTDDLVVRVIVDSLNKTASIYVTPDSTLSVTGHVLRHTVKLPKSMSTLGDALMVDAVGSGAGSVDITLKSLRLGNGVVLPNKRPVAVVGSDLSVPVVGSVQLDGSDSYDPEDADLTYLWTITRQPEGSDAVLSGMEMATYDLSDVTITAVAKGSAGNGQRVVINDPGLNVLNDTLILTVNGSGHVVITLRHETAAPSGMTSADELVSAIMNPTDGSYNADVAALITAELTGTATDTVLATAVAGVELTGGADSSEERPYFYPQVVGLYEFSLVVNDGDLDSVATTMLVSCLESAVEIGRIPDPSFVWQYLPDFMDMVSDRTVLESVWRGLIQLVGAEMLRLWQVDRNKSLRDIQSKLQSKWVGYPAAYSPAGALANLNATERAEVFPLDDGDNDLFTSSMRITMEIDLSVADKVVLYGDDGVESQLLTVKDFKPWRLLDTSATLTIGSSTIIVPSGNLLSLGIEEDDPVFVTLSGGTQARFAVHKVTSTTQLEIKGLSLVAAPANALIQVGGLLTFEEDTVACYDLVDSGTNSGVATDDGAGSASVTAWFELAYSEFSVDIVNGDKLRIDSAELPTLPTVSTRTSSKLTLSTAALTTYETQYVSWEVVRSRLATATYVRKLPWFEAEESLDTVSVSDYVKVKGAAYTYYGRVEAVSDTAFAFRDLGDSEGERSITGVEEGTVSVLRVTELPATEDVLSVPRLKRHGGAEEYLQEGVDYSTDAPSLVFIRTQLTVTRVAGSAVVTVTDGDADGVEGYLRFLDAAESGSYFILSVDDDEITLDTAMNSSGSAEAEVIPLTPENVPDTWWAEYTYSNNWKAIEDNFGVLVGLTHDDFSAISGGDYLSAVRAIHFALWSGPTVSNLQLGGHVFFNLPFSEAEGTIIELNEAHSATQGRIVIRDSFDDAIVRSYYFPLAAGLAVNPDTDVKYVVGDVVKEFSALSNGVKVKDYINAPTWFDEYLTGAQELRKFHSFKVEVDLNAVADAGAFRLLSVHMDRAKPQYTDYIMVGLTNISDDIDVTDDQALVLTQNVLESPYTTPDGSILAGTAVTVTSTTLRLDSEAAPIDDVYNGMLLRINTGPGAGQTVGILDYTGATRTCLVAGWSSTWGTPTAVSTYNIVNPPSFRSGFFPDPGYYDGRGNWNSATQRENFPFGGDPPTALVAFSTLVGSPVYGETVIRTGGKSFGKYIGHSGTTMWLDVIGGSVPQAADGMTFNISGATATVVAASIRAWPDYAYVNRDRSEIWIPLYPDTIVGPVAESGSLQAAAGAVVTLALTAADEDYSYDNWMIVIGGNNKRIVSYVGATRQATLLSAIGGLVGNEAYTLSPPRSIAVLRDLDFFKVGSIVKGQTSGHTAQVMYHGPSYLRLINSSHNPYQSFTRGEVLTGENGERATAISDVFYVTPDYMTRHDRRELHGPWARTDARLCFYVGVDGKAPTVDMGLVFDDTELFQYPYDPTLSDAAQFVPSFGPGLYWWADNLLVYNTVDTSPTGPGSEPPWLPSPDIDITVTSIDPLWNSNALNDVAICRVVPSNPLYPPAVSAIPDPVIVALL